MKIRKGGRRKKKENGETGDEQRKDNICILFLKLDTWCKVYSR